MKALAQTTRVLERALASRAFSGVTAEVGGRAGADWRLAAGHLSHHESAAAVTADTVFDLASLTKVLATTTLVMGGVRDRRLRLDAPVSGLIPQWSAADRATVTVRDLLEHASGLPAYQPYYRRLSGGAAYQAAIGAEPLAYPPRTQSIYSDPGFILLGFILEDVGGLSLADQFRRWRVSAGVRDSIDYLPPSTWRPRIAATEFDAWRGRLIQGEVHDENAVALGGIAGHAGLFGTAAAVGDAARWWLNQLAQEQSAIAGGGLTLSFLQRSRVSGSSRALGWDTMLPTSSCGSRWSPRAVGHTGFTGTSLWLDPARDLYAVLLTNRVHPTRENQQIGQVRRDFHDAIIADLQAAGDDVPS